MMNASVTYPVPAAPARMLPQGRVMYNKIWRR